MQKVIIFGGTGFIGIRLAKYLADKGFHPIIVARNATPASRQFEFIAWDGHNAGPWCQALEGAHAIVNLAGKTVDCIKTPDNCDLILRSRVDATRAIAEGLKLVQNTPKIWIQMSTAHIYGDPRSQHCTESASFGYGLAPFVGQAWERTFLEGLPAGTREVRLRTSFVIGKDGGALEALVRITKLGLGGRAGHGQQGFSWLHEDDMCDIIYQAIINDTYHGVYNVTAPEPVSNAVFMQLLRKQLGIKLGLPSPAWMIRLGAALFFKTDPDLVLYGRYIVPARLQEANYHFKFPSLQLALKDLLGQ